MKRVKPPPRSLDPAVGIAMSDLPRRVIFALGDGKRRRTNADLIVDCRDLGYLSDRQLILDPTYGANGGFWKKWRPAHLVACDLDPKKSPTGSSVDFTRLDSYVWPGRFDAITLDPPYGLHGTTKPGDSLKARFGIVGNTGRKKVYALSEAGIISAHTVLKPRGFLLLKTQDQVEGGKVRWLSRDLANFAEQNGYEQIDMLLLRSYRAQPNGRAQQHARRDVSQLLVFRKVK